MGFRCLTGAGFGAALGVGDARSGRTVSTIVGLGAGVTVEVDVAASAQTAANRNTGHIIERTLGNKDGI